MPTYSFLNEAWSDPVMVQDNSGKFIRNSQQGRDELDNQFKDKEKKYNFEEKPKVIKNTLPDYGVDDYQIYDNKLTKKSNKKSNKHYQNNFDNTFFDNIEESDEISEEESEEESDNSELNEIYQEIKHKVNKPNKVNKVNKTKKIKSKKYDIEGSNKYIELKDYVHDLENKINDFKIDSLNKSQSIFGDINTNEMIIFLALGLFTIMVLDSFTKLGSKLKTHN